MPCRKTLWNWKKKGKPRRSPITGLSRGRRLRNDNPRHDMLIKTAALLDEAIKSGQSSELDYIRVTGEIRERSLRPTVLSVFDAISQWHLPVELVAVATCDELKLGTRTRRRRQTMTWTAPAIADALVRKFQDSKFPISAVDAARYAQAYVDGDEDAQRWIDFVLEEDKRREIPVNRRCCVSKIFRRIKRRMSCYWRKHPDYQRCRDLLRTLIFKLVMQQQSFEVAPRSSDALA